MPESQLEGTVLITGASGFIGRRLRDALLSANTDVVAIRRRGSPEAEVGRSVVADYQDVDGLTEILASERPSYVLHVAGVTKGRTYADFQSGNVTPTRSLLQALRRAELRVERFVHVSSLAAYGPSRVEAPLSETDSPQPIEHYGRSKLEAERVVENEAGSVPWTIVRPAGVYGPGDVDYFNLFQSAMRGWNVFFGNRDRWMSLIYVDDCVRAILQSANRPQTLGKGYFVAQDEAVTWQRFQNEIVEAVPRKVRTLDLPGGLVSLGALGGELATLVDRKPRLLNFQKLKMGAQRAWTCNSDAAKTDFDFDARIGLSEGIRRTHDWYSRQGWY